MLKFYFLLFLIFIFYGCSPYKTLRPGQKILYRESIKGNKTLDKSNFRSLYMQKPNKTFLGTMPLIPIYNFGYIFFDSNNVKKKIDRTTKMFEAKIEQNKNNEDKTLKLQKKADKKLTRLNRKLTEGNFIMRMGEAPVVYDSTKIYKTAELMEYYLYSEGFFRGTAVTQIDSLTRKVKVLYKITEGDSTFISQLLYKIPDQNIDTIVKQNLKASFIKTGERYRQENLTKERDRITRVIKDKGYYDFGSAYIYFNVDTSKHELEAQVQMVISNPKGKTHHDVYRIDSVLFITNETRPDNVEGYDTSYYDGVKYVINKNIKFSKKVADRKLRLHPGDLFTQSGMEQTQKNLSFLDMFRTVGIFFTADTNQHLLRTKIQANSIKKHQLIGETGLTISQSYIYGPFGSLNYYQRNTFRGFGLFEISSRAAITAQAAVFNPNSFLGTIEYFLYGALSFPQLYLPLFRSLKWEDYNPRTKITAGYSFIKRTEYQRGIGQLILSYNINPDKFRSILFTPLDINLVNTARISDTFQVFLQDLQKQGDNLITSFKSSFVSDISFTHIFNNHDIYFNKRARYTKYYFESGGTIYNLTRTKEILGLQTFRYLRSNIEFRFYFPMKKNTFAMRLNVGSVYPYAQNNGLPYEKYFFAGGPNSIRAWPLRRLGPGSFAVIDSATGKISYRIEQPGEFLLEANFEYRFKIVGFFEGAAFIDAGNIWMLTNEAGRPGAQLQLKNLLSEIAIGSGLGLRLNFNFLIVRLDLGVKVYNPATKRLVPLSTGWKQSLINLGFGYPF